MVWIVDRPKTRCQVWKCTAFWMIVKCGTFKHLHYLLIRFIDKLVCTVSVNLKSTNDIHVNIKYLHVWRIGCVLNSSLCPTWKNGKRSCGSFTSFLGETHQDSGVAQVKSGRLIMRIYYNTPNNAQEREEANI